MNVIKVSVLVLVLIFASLFLIEVVRLIQLKQTVGTYRNFWLERGKEFISPDDVLYVALGDSAAQGIGASSPQKGYVGLIVTALAQKTRKNVRVVNLSVTGAKLQDLIDQQLPQLNKLALDDKTIVTVEIGANDMGTFDSAVFTEQMTQIVSRLPKQTVIADIPYFGGGRYRQHENSALAASTIIHSLADKRGLVVAPLHAVTQERDSFFINAADLFHPNNRGYRNWYEAFRRAMSL